MQRRDSGAGTPPGRHWSRWFSAAAVAVVLLAQLSGCGGSGETQKPEPGSVEYERAVSAFYVGLAALQTSDDVRAGHRLGELTQLVPREPAGWANFGLLALRHREFETAAERLERARELAPESAEIAMLFGLLESGRGRFAEAVAHLERATKLDPTNLKAKYALGQELERQGDPSGAERALEVYGAILESKPDNLEALLDVARLASARGDTERYQHAVERIANAADAFPAEAEPHVDALRSASGSDLGSVGRSIAFLRNLLARTPAYRESVDEVKCPPGIVGEPLERFLWLPEPTPVAAPRDDALRFVSEPVPSPPVGPWSWAGAIVLEGDAAPVLVVANGQTARVGATASVPFPGGAGATAPGQNGLLGVDFDYDFKTDLVAAGAGGVRVFRQENSDSFADVTARTALPPAVANASYAGVWALDVEADGDLDLLLAAESGPPVVLRNNGDGSFVPRQPFEGAADVRGFVWADLDGDGDSDAALVDGGGGLSIFANERLGSFRRASLPAEIGQVLAVAAGDVTEDGTLDLVAWQTGGAVVRIGADRGGDAWSVGELARFEASNSAVEPAGARLIVADLDNNGSLDLLASDASSARILLGDSGGSFAPPATPALDGPVFGVVDRSGDGLLDLIGLAPDGALVQSVAAGTKGYKWTDLRPRARSATGDQRINSYGVGGEIEVRSGLLVQTLPITGPHVRFGLGTHTAVDVARIVWPNGTLQAEFDLESGSSLVFDQRLKGSCPFVFADGGSGMQFVTDFIWRSPLGLSINAQQTGSVVQTEDWVRIRGDQLAERDGAYEVRITAELWETHFFDHVSLMTVDHPEGTDVFVDERFSIPPPKLQVHATEAPLPIAGAWTDSGKDVTEVVRSVDGRYLDEFGRGQYQGVTRDHYVEVAIPDEAPTTAPLLLVANGWIHPTDSSINVALGQGGQAPPRGLSVEVPDGRGGWRVAIDNLGFPSGKNKTILVPLDGLFPSGAPRRLRLRTNLEIYWDAIQWAPALVTTPLRTERLEAAVAELRYRGFSVMGQADASSPEIPDYNRISGTAPRWLDLVGFYTRFGDVRELLKGVDDRYVILNAGDEMVLRFTAPPPPPDGWTRDFVLVGDGWVKDGDYNTTFSKTVLPLPSHDRPDYAGPVVPLHEDPVYRRYPEDWVTYHTRYITPDWMRSALRMRRE